MTSPTRLTLPAAALLLAGAAPYAAQLDLAHCRSLPARQAAELGPDWSALAPYVQRCAVRGPDGRTALSVDIVRLDRAYADDAFRTDPTRAVPRPVLRDATGAAVGELPEGFPVDAPGRLRVRFTDWRRGIPHAIRLYEAGESAVPPHPLPPMHWDPGARRYR